MSNKDKSELEIKFQFIQSFTKPAVVKKFPVKKILIQLAKKSDFDAFYQNLRLHIEIESYIWVQFFFLTGPKCNFLFFIN